MDVEMQTVYPRGISFKIEHLIFGSQLFSAEKVCQNNCTKYTLFNSVLKYERLPTDSVNW